MSEKALITGASGFIGRHTARLFSARGWVVTGIGHGEFKDFKDWGLSEWQRSDITLDSLRSFAGRPDLIVHCAGGASVGASIAEPLADFERTVHTTASVMEYVRRYSPGARVVYPSSAAVYGAAERTPIPEEALLRPMSPYGAHKKMAEEVCRSYSASFGVGTAIVRLFSVYGPGLKKQLLWEGCRKIRNGEKDFWGAGSEVRDWLHVEDAAGLLFIAGEKASRESPAVNGGSGEGVTVREFLQEAFRRFGRDDGPVFSGKAREGDPLRYEADISKARLWGWSPKTGWRQGVGEYVEWFRKSGL